MIPACRPPCDDVAGRESDRSRSDAGPDVGVPRQRPFTYSECGDARELGTFERGAGCEYRVRRAGIGQGRVDDPAVRLDTGSSKVVLEVGGFSDRSRLGERDDDDLARGGVLESHQRGDHPTGLLGDAFHCLAVVGAGDVEQEQGVSGWCRVDDDKLVVGAAEEPVECLEHGDFLRARRAQVFGEQVEMGLVETFAGA